MTEDPFPTPPAEPAAGNETEATERVFDNLPAWGLFALAVGLLYMVWATLEVLALIMGDLPKVGV